MRVAIETNRFTESVRVLKPNWLIYLFASTTVSNMETMIPKRAPKLGWRTELQNMAATTTGSKLL